MIRLLLLLLLGCGPSEETDSGLDPCEVAALESPSVQIGTGEVFFESIDEGQQLGFVQGAQGGFHIPGSLRAHGLVPGNLDSFTDPSNPLLTWTVITKEGASLGGYSLPRPLKVRSDGVLEVVGDLVLLDIGTRDEAIGVEVTLGVELLDICGTQVSDQRTVVLFPMN